MAFAPPGAPLSSRRTVRNDEQEKADVGLLENEIERYALLARKAMISLKSGMSFCEGALFQLTSDNRSGEANIIQYIIDYLTPAENALNEMVEEQIRKGR